MTNAEKYFENCVNLTHTILGQKLKPFCILHYQWLEHIKSPLVVTSQVVTIGDLEIAVLICSSSSNEEILSKLQVPPRWSIKGIKRTLWRIRNSKLDTKAELQKFIAYQDDYSSLPAFMGSSDEPHEKLPWLLLYCASLIKATGWTEEKVMTLPLGKVFWLNSAFNYLATGETSVVSDREQAAMDALTRLTKT